MTLIYIAWWATAVVAVGSLCRPAKFFHTKPLLYGFVCGDIVMMEQEKCSSNCNHKAGSTHLSEILYVVAMWFPFREQGANLKQTLTEIRQKYVDSSSTEGIMCIWILHIKSTGGKRNVKHKLEIQFSSSSLQAPL